LRAVPMHSPNPAPTGGYTIMSKCTSVVRCPVDGGFQKLQEDGAVINQDCPHYSGSWLEPTMDAARQGQPVLPFVEIVSVDNRGNYVIVRQDGAVYGPDFGYGLL
jgi:hypothetical protein